MQIDTNRHVIWFSDGEVRNLISISLIRPALCVSGLWQPIDVKIGEENVLNVRGKALTLIREDITNLYEQRRVVVKVKVRTAVRYDLIIDDETAKSGQLIQ